MKKRGIFNGKPYSFVGYVKTLKALLCIAYKDLNRVIIKHLVYIILFLLLEGRGRLTSICNRNKLEVVGG